MVHSFPELAAIINFIVLAGALVFAIRKPLKGFLATRSDVIRVNVEESERLQQEALNLVRTYETKLAKLDEEIKSLINDARQDGEKEKVEILARADRMSQQIIENAKNMATREIEKQKDRLQKDLMTKVIEEARKNLKEKVTEKDHGQFTQRFIEEIGVDRGDVN